MSAQAPTMDRPHRIPLVATIENRDDTLNKDAKLVNCYMEKNTKTGEYFLEKRPGLLKESQKSGNGNGCFHWNGDIYTIFGATIYKNGVSLGTVDSSNGVYRFVQVRGAPERLVFGNGVEMYYIEDDHVYQIAAFMPVYAGSFEIDSEYTIITTGNTDFLACGADAQPTNDAEVTSGDFVIGNIYTITYLGSYTKSNHVWQDKRTDFTLLGAASNTVGVSFVATGTGPSDKNGRAKPATPPTTTDVFTATDVGSGTGSCALNITSLEVGKSYKINFIGTSDFTKVGAANNVVGEIFTAVKAGTGTGNVLVANAFPENFCKGFAYLDGTLYVMDTDGVIRGTRDLDDPRIWDALNYITARVEPDKGVALAKQGVYVIALKEWTSEVFYDAGNVVGSPLAPVLGAKSSYGCVNADSLQESDDELFWVSSNRSASTEVVRMSKLQVEAISTPAIEKLLGEADLTTIHSWIFKIAGHRFYGITLKNSNLTLVYDIDQDWWYQWTDSTGNYWKMVGATYTTDQKHLMQHESNGCMYYLNTDYVYHSDDGLLFPVDIYTPNSDFSINRRKALSLMYFNGDQTPGSDIFIRVSDDDYQTWSNYRRVDMGLKRPMLQKCGTFVRRAWHIRHCANTSFRIRSIDLQLDIGAM